jgi:hypothetical protein
MLNMKLQHVVGFVLVAWYLILPPLMSSGQRPMYEPLSEWNLIDEFDSESVCRQMRAKLIKRMPGTAIDYARCVPSNDPDLVPILAPGIADDLGGG